MSRRWLLSLFCLSVPLLLFVQLTSAGGGLRVDEATTRIQFRNERTEVLLPVENSTGAILNSTAHLEILDPQNHVRATVERSETIGRDRQTLTFSLPLDVTKLAQADRSRLLWYRLHYRVTRTQPTVEPLAEGVVSLSEIMPALFEIRVAAGGFVLEGMRYRARVQTIHPITRRPAKNVQIDGEVTLEDDSGKAVRLRASGVTDSLGYAQLDFQLPPRFPEFPHNVVSDGGGIHVTGSRDGLTAKAEGRIVVDQFPRILISSDKPLYQPGQVLHARALVFSPSRHAVTNQGIVLKITDPEDTSIFRTTLKSSRFGIVNGDWPIPDNARLGSYRISVGIDGGEESQTAAYDVRVSRYDLPNFSVSVLRDRSYYVSGQNAEVKVKAHYLFGQPVTRGHVRVVREADSEWNYKEQKWDIEEGDKYEGDTDANGVFVARINLGDDHDKLGEEEYGRFRDISYAAYFTDPTTKRTEQRRFDLRVTREPIHVYVIRADNDYSPNPALPWRFYVSTFYADGSPAQCTVRVQLRKAKEGANKGGSENSLQAFATLRTSRYGLAKVNSLRLPRSFDDDWDSHLIVLATDSRGNKGSRTEDLSTDDSDSIRVETDKTLYGEGEPIMVLVTSSAANMTAVVDVASNWSVIRSQRVRLHGGRAEITLPYQPEFKDMVTIAAYADFAETRSMISTHSVLYPRNRDLKVSLRSSQETYRPGDEARVSLEVRSPRGRPADSALGLVVFDRAVDERVRTDREFGKRYHDFNDSLRYFLGYDNQIAGVTLRDLERVNMSQPVPLGLDLLAEVLLNQGGNYYWPVFFDGDQYETNQAKVFADIIDPGLRPLREALERRYERTGEYPVDETTLRRLLSDAGIDFAALRDPWGTRYRAAFSVDRQLDLLTLKSAGADKRFETTDDFSVERSSWAYFRPVGEAINRVVHQYHERTGLFLRDYPSLRGELQKEGLSLDAVRDRWEQPYGFEFDVEQSRFVVKVRSGGPDKRLTSVRSYPDDDFLIWTSPIDYFAEPRARIDAALSRHLKATTHFPQNEAELADALRNSEGSLTMLHDPWGRPYYAAFITQSIFSDHVRMENRAQYGTSTTERVQITPVTQQLIVVSLRSTGADGKPGTPDDFDVATFKGVLSEQTRADTQRRVLNTTIVLTAGNGAITGVVTDPQGAVIPNATVTVTINSQARTATTDSEGRYQMTNLSPGTYEVQVEFPGFIRTVITNVVVQTSNVITVNIELRPGAPTETVTVSSGAPQLQTSSSESSRTKNYTAEYGRNKAAAVNIVTKSGGARDHAYTPRLREYFPETLVWQPALETDKHGRAQFNFRLADNITTWKMAVISSTEDGQIGIAEKEIKSFQPFFVEHDPPRVLTEGDEISLPVVVRNYLTRGQAVDLDIKPENWFVLVGPAHKRAEVAAGDSTRETFALRAVSSVKDGQQRITATAADDSDAIEKPVTVHPDGEEQTATASDVVGDRATLDLNIPAAVIPNSILGELKIYPNLMGHVTESVEAIMKRPYGCGEQTISSTYPSLLLLRHYKQTKPNAGGAPATAGGSDALRVRAERYLNEGYNRLLNYRDTSGGFTYWGRGYPDVALTAYALRFLNDASDLIEVESDASAKASAWLLTQQAADGSWPFQNHWSNVEERRQTALLTAYVARVLAAIQQQSIASSQKSTPQKASDQSDALRRALDYLSRRLDEIEEPYLLAAYALASFDAGDAARAAPAVAKLRELAHTEGNTTYWSLETNTPFYGWGLAGRVETTALAIQALARSADTEPRAVATGSTVTSSSPFQTAPTERRNQSLTPSPNVPQSIASGSQPSSNAAPTQADIANLPAPAPPASQTNDHLVRSGLLFLLKEKDRYGVWYSTQATINVLDAMLLLLQKGAEDRGAPFQSKSQSFAEIIVNGQSVQAVPMPPANQFGNPIIVDVSRFLRAATNRIEVRRGPDSAPASVQAVVTYYVPWSASSATRDVAARTGDSDGLRLIAKFDRTEGKVSDEISCHVEAERVGFRGYGMMLAEIGLPPGADVDRASLETAMKSSDWAMSQYDILPDRVVVYLWPRAGGVRFDFKFRPRFGLKARTAPSLIYDYYNPDARAVIAPVLFSIR